MVIFQEQGGHTNNISCQRTFRKQFTDKSEYRFFKVLNWTALVRQLVWVFLLNMPYTIFVIFDFFALLYGGNAWAQGFTDFNAL